MKLDKIHRILVQSIALVKNLRRFNARLRANATNEFFKKTFFKLRNSTVVCQPFKLMPNAVFGKTMENIGKYRIVKLLTSWEGRYGANHYISNPAFCSSTIFDDNLVSVEMRKTEILFGKPLYVESLIYDINCDGFYEIINKNVHKFDTSQFKEDNPYCIPRVNKKVVGLMKDENNGVIMTEFVGLRAKMYRIKCGLSHMPETIPGNL
ncbi:hypothetical protein NQ315_014829 [Exocentrus adspersus]|uniref:Uncharacterized protein n=1 Tax=Exocentrus adspersus TaxID=1586481 RepID=A0AAV8VN30_9CUCU|nr:hypothetical protein NQ315_014829 [Exocentrus adspersus]